MALTLKSWRDISSILIASIRVFLILIIVSVICISHLTWILLLSPLRLFLPSLYWVLEACLFRPVWLVILSLIWPKNHEIKESGDDVGGCYCRRSLFLINHQSIGDIAVFGMAVVAMGFFAISDLMWVVSHRFMLVNLGWVCKARGDFLLKRNVDVDTRDKELCKLVHHLKETLRDRHRLWITLFPEGIFLKRAKAKSQEFSKDHNLPVLHHVLWPRVGALHAITTALLDDRKNNNIPVDGDEEDKYHYKNVSSRYTPSEFDNDERSLRYVVDVTIAYPDQSKPMDFGTMAFCSGDENSTIHLHYRVYDAQDLPRDREELKQWMYERYREKEQLLATFYRTGSFPARTSSQAAGIQTLPTEGRYVPLTSYGGSHGATTCSLVLAYLAVTCGLVVHVCVFSQWYLLLAACLCCVGIYTAHMYVKFD